MFKTFLIPATEVVRGNVLNPLRPMVSNASEDGASPLYDPWEGGGVAAREAASIARRRSARTVEAGCWGRRHLSELSVPSG